MPHRLSRMGRWIRQRAFGISCLAILLVLLGGFAISLESTRPHVDGEPLRYDVMVDLVESGRVQEARVLNYDAYVVGTYRRRDGRLQRFRSPALRAFAGGGGAPAANLVELLVDNRVPTTIDQQVGKGIAGIFTFVLPGLAASLLIVYVLAAWRLGKGMFAPRRPRRGPLRGTPKSGFADVAGQADAVAELREIVEAVRDPERFAALGAHSPKGVLLYGPPGSGKTLMARALAGEAGAAFFDVSGSEFVEMYAGVGASRVRDLFREARESAPAIVFIDELDAIGGRRAADGPSRSQDEREQALNQILTEMDGFHPGHRILVVGATNRPDVLDPALLRPGRFDRSVGLARVDEHGRLEILALHARTRPLAPDADLAAIARQAVGLTGADLANLVNEAALLAVRGGRTAIGAEHLQEALTRIREAPERQRRLAQRDRAPGRQTLAEERVGFEQVAGIDEVLDELKDVRDYLDDPQRFERMGARTPKGFLLAGPPGCGKTLVARAIASETNAAFFWIAASELTEVFAGEGAARVRNLFADARNVAPAIVFIDELDAAGGMRSMAQDSGGREMDSTLNQLLVELDGVGERAGVVVIAATNRPDMLDPALVRRGRFDRTIAFGLPDRAARRAILEVHARGKPLAPGTDLDRLAAGTAGLSGADLAAVLNEAALLAARRGLELIDGALLDEAVDRLELGVGRGHRLTDEERRIVAVHEAGHAVVARALDGRVPQRITLMSRGSVLGLVRMEDTESRVMRSRASLLDEMAAYLAGITAEQLVFGHQSGAGGSDLVEVTRIANLMVRELGMTMGLVPLAYPAGPGAPYSDETARRIDAEVAALVDEARQRCLAVLRASRRLVDAIADALVERETITGEELEAIAASPHPGAGSTAVGTP